tara:strand:+ start:516 stop:1235 length:720 start_codon:yes stop_codon:yes gene_type:complete
MGYFRELPNILYPSPVPSKRSSGDMVEIKNLFRRAKLFDYVSDAAALFDKYIVEDGERPDTIADELYGNPQLDYVVVIVAGITNIHQQWPIQDFQMYDFALAKYGSETEMNKTHHYETYEIKDSQGRQILPPNLIVDKDFTMDGSSLRFGNNRFIVYNQSGAEQLSDKAKYTIIDNIARPVTNFKFEIDQNDKNREIDVLKPSYLQTFINDLRDVVRYSKHSSYISRNLATTELRDLTS